MLKAKILKQPHLLFTLVLLNTMLLLLNSNLIFKQHIESQIKSVDLLKINKAHQEINSINMLREQIRHLKDIKSNLQAYYPSETFTESIEAIAEKDQVRINEIHIGSNNIVRVSISASILYITNFLNDLLKQFAAISMSEIAMQDQHTEVALTLPKPTDS